MSCSEPIAAAVLAAAAAVLVYRARRQHYRPLELLLHLPGCVRRYSITIDALRRMPATTMLDDGTRGVPISEIMRSVMGREADRAWGD